VCRVSSRGRVFGSGGSVGFIWGGFAVTAYYFEPMMSRYRRFGGASIQFLMSPAGRSEIAEALQFCRRNYGRAEAVRFRQGLLWVGYIYPIALRRVWERLESV